MTEQQVVVRFYTRARKIPVMLGKLGDFKIPGGPYTLTQGVVFVATAGIGKETMWIWARGWVPILAWLVLIAVAAGCAVVAGRIPFKGRNPVMLVTGVIGYAMAPSWGTQGGSHIALSGKRKIRHRSSTPSNVAWNNRAHSVDADATEEAIPPTHSTDQAPAPVGPHQQEREATAPTVSHQHPTPHQLSEVQQILAASAQRR